MCTKFSSSKLHVLVCVVCNNVIKKIRGFWPRKIAYAWYKGYSFKYIASTFEMNKRHVSLKIKLHFLYYVVQYKADIFEVVS